MNIDRVNQNLANGAYGLRGRRTGGAADPSVADPSGSSVGSSAAPSADGLSLSSEGRSISRAQAAVRASPDVRQQLVERLHQEVQSGRYVTKDEAIAQLLAEGANQ